MYIQISTNKDMSSNLTFSSIIFPFFPIFAHSSRDPILYSPRIWGPPCRNFVILKSFKNFQCDLRQEDWQGSSVGRIFVSGPRGHGFETNTGSLSKALNPKLFQGYWVIGSFHKTCIISCRNWIETYMHFRTLITKHVLLLCVKSNSLCEWKQSHTKGKITLACEPHEQSNLDVCPAFRPFFPQYGPVSQTPLNLLAAKRCAVWCADLWCGGCIAESTSPAILINFLRY